MARAGIANSGLWARQVELLSLAEGFFPSTVLFALVRLRVFERLGEGERALDDLARELGARPAPLARLLRAGVVLNLLESADGVTFRAGAIARPFLVSPAVEGYLGDWIRGLDEFRAALSRLDRAVLTGEPTVDPAAHLGGDEARTRWFAAAMHDAAACRAAELAQVLDTSGVRDLLDLGCGPGTYAFHLGLRNPSLRLHLADLPGALAFAREISTRYPLANEIHYHALDLTHDPMPGTYELVLLSNTLHMLGERASRRLLAEVFRAVRPGGSLVVQAQYFREDAPGQRSPVFIDLLQLCTTTEGRNHSVEETRLWLEEAGFVDVEFRSLSVLNPHSFLRGYRG